MNSTGLVPRGAFATTLTEITLVGFALEAYELKDANQTLSRSIRKKFPLADRTNQKNRSNWEWPVGSEMSTTLLSSSFVSSLFSLLLFLYFFFLPLSILALFSLYSSITKPSQAAIFSLPLSVLPSLSFSSLFFTSFFLFSSFSSIVHA